MNMKTQIIKMNMNYKIAHSTLHDKAINLNQKLTRTWENVLHFDEQD